ncbi:hypothetical protein BO94DRAFT_451576, partial [Aspergillus sclerotioniger CBS 115572]
MTWARRGDEIPEAACFPGHPGLRLAPEPWELADLVTLPYSCPANELFQGPGTAVMRKGLDGSGSGDKSAEETLRRRHHGCGALGYMISVDRLSSGGVKLYQGTLGKSRKTTTGGCQPNPTDHLPLIGPVRMVYVTES